MLAAPLHFLGSLQDVHDDERGNLRRSFGQHHCTLTECHLFCLTFCGSCSTIHSCLRLSRKNVLVSLSSLFWGVRSVQIGAVQCPGDDPPVLPVREPIIHDDFQKTVENVESGSPKNLFVSVRIVMDQTGVIEGLHDIASSADPVPTAGSSRSVLCCKRRPVGFQ